jgi:nicotinate-nucleotide adenylyltransferase
MKTGILGGTFNPIHCGHIEMMEKALEEEDLDDILLIPTGDPPHKDKKDLISKYDRYEMCLLSAMSLDNVFVSSIEVEREGTTYTIDTLLELEKRYGIKENIYFIVGADTLFKLETWKDIEKVAKRCIFLAFPREDASFSHIEEEAERLRQEHGMDIRIMKSHVLDVSSSKIREMVNRGSDIERMVPGKVREYIIRNKIYSGER